MDMPKIVDQKITYAEIAKLIVMTGSILVAGAGLYYANRQDAAIIHMKLDQTMGQVADLTQTVKQMVAIQMHQSVLDSQVANHEKRLDKIESDRYGR